MKKLFILALMPIMASFTALGMNPSFQGQNDEIPVITFYLEDTDPRIQPNQYIGNPIYATLVPGAMPALNNNTQIDNFYVPNDKNQPIAPVQFQEYQNQSKKRTANYPQQNKRLKTDFFLNQNNDALQVPSSNNIDVFPLENNLPPEYDNDPQQYVPNFCFDDLSIGDDGEIIELKSFFNNQNQTLAFDDFQNPIFDQLNINQCVSLEIANTNQGQSITLPVSQLQREKLRKIDAFKNIKSTDLNPISLRLFFEKIYKNIFEDNKLFEIKDTVLQELISKNDIEKTKLNIEKLFWAINCPEDNCPHTTYTSTAITRYSLTLHRELKNHIKAVHTDNSDLEKITDKIKQQKINLVLDKKKPQSIITLSMQNLKNFDNNITSIRKHLEKFYQNRSKNNQLFEIKDEVLKKLISASGIKQTKQNIATLFLAIDCPTNGCPHTMYTSINTTRYLPVLYRGLKKHINTHHANNAKEIIDKIKQQQINLVSNKKKQQKKIKST